MYTEEEKLSFIKQYLESGKSKTSFCRPLSFTVGSLNLWLSHYGNPDLAQINKTMNDLGIPSDESLLREEVISLRKQLQAVEKHLKEEKLKNMANELIIDLAERKYHIRIRKNSDAK